MKSASGTLDKIGLRNNLLSIESVGYTVIIDRAHCRTAGKFDA
jgi:hypothetical protein